MSRYKLVAFTNPADGRDAEFNHWYDHQHIPDVLAIPGITSTERMVCVHDGPHRYMTIYDVDVTDVHSVMNEITARAGGERMQLSDALDMTSTAAAFWEPVAKG